jgi:hypothetical protein
MKNLRSKLTVPILTSALAMTSIVTAVNSYGEDAITAKVVETVTFKLVAGVSQDQFLVAADATNAFLKSRKGFVSRKLIVDKDGQYTDIALWASLKDAETAMADSMKVERLVPFINAIDPATMKIDHQPVILSSE